MEKNQQESKERDKLIVNYGANKNEGINHNETPKKNSFKSKLRRKIGLDHDEQKDIELKDLNKGVPINLDVADNREQTNQDEESQHDANDPHFVRNDRARQELLQDDQNQSEISILADNPTNLDDANNREHDEDGDEDADVGEQYDGDEVPRQGDQNQHKISIIARSRLWLKKHQNWSIIFAIISMGVQLFLNSSLGYLYEPCFTATLLATIINFVLTVLFTLVFMEEKFLMFFSGFSTGQVISIAVCFVMSFDKKCGKRKHMKRHVQEVSSTPVHRVVWIYVIIMAGVMIISLWYLLSRRRKKLLLSQEV